ncbi:SEL1-like repeat protein [Dyella mobilis]|uniref:SEL1-like repeat protein n=1 Tax=Dyella mobilis TaxID=1849582 RepID=A0ABS2KED1_9GAMM|nr:SEL1-like repeat protein [Dyella mobilis]MBM7129253.1 SEL1-like repeat protein [Dyella mobilis]GLQ98546.1 hypothetical protein GCM10007863_29660 [Dyella mobilis]
MQWVFEALGIDQNADTRTVRKAYAKAIKQCDQANDVEGFQKIRRAYELALQWAKGRESGAAGAPPQQVSTRDAESAAPPVSPEQPSSADAPPGLRTPASPVQPGMSARRHHPQAHEVLDALAVALREADGTQAHALLEASSRDDRLTSLDEKMAFEQALLVFCFANPPNINLLDAACDLFGWETSNKHLAMRPDLVARMRRQLALRAALSMRNAENRREIEDALLIYRAVKRQPDLRIEPWQIVKANQVLDRCDPFRRELEDRYGAEALDWWRRKLADNSGLLDAYHERQAKEREFAQLKIERRPQNPAPMSPSSFVRLLICLVIITAILNHFQKSSSSVDDLQTTSTLSSDYRYQGADHLSSTSLSPAAPSPYEQNEVVRLRHRADQGDADAEDYLGRKYERGQDVPKDPGIALIWYGRAADRGFADAQYNLGEMYMRGEGVPRTPLAAIQWWKAAALQGHLAAQDRLAEVYFNGDGVKQDYRAALHWWQLASKNGDAEAEDGLGDLYAGGRGVLRDYAAAANWYRKAAAQGAAAALVHLGLMYETGEGVQQNRMIAYALLSMASGRGGSDPTQITAGLARLSKSLTVGQRNGAVALASKLSGSRDFLDELDRAAAMSHPS